MINYDELKQELRKMTPRSRLFQIVKEEMVFRRHWKNQPRGNPMQKGNDPRRRPQ